MDEVAIEQEFAYLSSSTAVSRTCGCVQACGGLTLSKDLTSPLLVGRRQESVELRQVQSFDIFSFDREPGVFDHLTRSRSVETACGISLLSTHA